jgi:hypothetical protein
LIRCERTFGTTGPPYCLFKIAARSCNDVYERRHVVFPLWENNGYRKSFYISHDADIDRQRDERQGYSQGPDASSPATHHGQCRNIARLFSIRRRAESVRLSAAVTDCVRIAT